MTDIQCTMTPDARTTRDVKILREFVGLYCRNHRVDGKEHAAFCRKCQELLDHAIARRQECPLDPKPSCRNCRVHCYREPYRTQIREAMRLGAMYYVKRGRFDKLLKLAFNKED